MKRLLVDFNEVYDDECIWTSLRQMPPTLAPRMAETVELYDSDGEHCWAVVESIAGPIVHARIKWDTWGPASPRLPARPLSYDPSLTSWTGSDVLEMTP